MTGAAIIIYLVVWIFFDWLFYMWGASIAQGKGRSRALGWWSAIFGLLGILVLARMSSESQPQYIPSMPPSGNTGRRDIAGELERLAALKDRGALTEEEFTKRKQALLELN
jgi:hypothetical protein